MFGWCTAVQMSGCTYGCADCWLCALGCTRMLRTGVQWFSVETKKPCTTVGYLLQLLMSFSVLLLMQISVQFPSDRVVRPLLCVPRFQTILRSISFLFLVLLLVLCFALCFYLSVYFRKVRCLGLLVSVCWSCASFFVFLRSLFVCKSFFPSLCCSIYETVHRRSYTLHSRPCASLYVCVYVLVSILVVVPLSRLCVMMRNA